MTCIRRLAACALTKALGFPSLNGPHHNRIGYGVLKPTSALWLRSVYVCFLFHLPSFVSLSPQGASRDGWDRKKMAWFDIRAGWAAFFFGIGQSGLQSPRL